MNQTIVVSIGAYSMPQIVHGVLNDTGRDLIVKFSDFTLVSGDTAKMYVKKADGGIVNQDGTVSTTNNSVTISLTKALKVAGDNICTLEITRSSSVVSSFYFIVKCHGSAKYETHSGPAGEISITENGTYDISAYASATVNVSGGGGGDVRCCHILVEDYVFSWATYPSFVAFENGMTWAELVESDYNFEICDDELGNPVKMFALQLDGSVYMNLASYNSSYYESTYIAEGDSTISDSTLYNATYGSQCLVAGTKIKTANSAKNVENIKTGDKVATLDPETLELKTAVVEKVRNEHIPHDKMYSDKWFRYSFSDGSEFHITGRHRFFDVTTGKFEWAEDIKIGDKCYKIDGTMPELVSVEVFDERVEYNTFWNKDRANYFVDGFLSGNASTPIPNIKAEEKR